MFWTKEIKEKNKVNSNLKAIEDELIRIKNIYNTKNKKIEFIFKKTDFEQFLELTEDNVNKYFEIALREYELYLIKKYL